MGQWGGGLRLPMGREWQVRCEYDTSASEASVSVGMGRSHEMCNMYMMVSAPVPVGAFCGKPLGSSAADDERDADGAADAGRPEEEAPGARWPYPLAFAAPHQLRATPLSDCLRGSTGHPAHAPASGTLRSRSGCRWRTRS